MSKLTIKQKRFVDEYTANPYGVVYKIENKVNGKIYVGITTRGIATRLSEHCKANSGIGRAIRKYGISNFNIDVIDMAENQEELECLEVKYIKKYNSYREGYNQTIGGDGIKLSNDLEITLNKKQKRFINFAMGENKTQINTNDSNAIIKSVIINLINLYLTSVKVSDKIEVSKLILKLKPILLESVLETGLISLDELNHYSRQKISSFEVFYGY